MHRSFRQLVLVIAGGLAIAGCPLSAQTAAAPAGTPTFEVASIRQNLNPNPRWRMSPTADGVHAVDVTLLWVLHEAYGTGDSDLWSAGPAWLDKARFDIEAKYDVSKYPDLTREQHQATLQQLLADRFKLVVHKPCGLRGQRALRTDFSVCSPCSGRSRMYHFSGKKTPCPELL